MGGVKRLEGTVGPRDGYRKGQRSSTGSIHKGIIKQGFFRVAINCCDYNMNEKLIITGQISLCAVFTALFVIFLNHRLSNTREKTKERHQEGKNIISAFKQELDALIQTNNDCRDIMTMEAYKKHESAIRSFLPYLSWIDRFRFKRAWHRLAFHQNDTKGMLPFYEQYADLGSLDKRRSVRPFVIKEIERILSFAK